MPIDDPNVLLNDPDMSRDFLSDMLGTGEKKEKPPPDGKYLEYCGTDTTVCKNPPPALPALRYFYQRYTK